MSKPGSLSPTTFSTCPQCGWEEWPNAKRWTLKIKAAAISQNALKGNGRGRAGWAYRKARSGMLRQLRISLARCSRGERLGPAAGFRRAIITRLYRRGRRAFDYGNLVGGYKPFIDCLKEEGLLIDDSPKYFQGFYQQRPSPDGQDWIELVIEQRE